jgi:hypothetical protein
MAVGIAAATLNSWLNATFRNVAYTQPAEVWFKLHTGDPGSAGTSNAATETTRKQGAFSAASGGTLTTSAALEWTNVSTAETYSHWSAWTASAAGTFICSDDLATPRLVAVGDNFTIAAGDIDIAITPVAA